MSHVSGTTSVNQATATVSSSCAKTWDSTMRSSLFQAKATAMTPSPLHTELLRPLIWHMETFVNCKATKLQSPRELSWYSSSLHLPSSSLSHVGDSGALVRQYVFLPSKLQIVYFGLSLPWLTFFTGPSRIYSIALSGDVHSAFNLPPAAHCVCHFAISQLPSLCVRLISSQMCSLTSSIW